MRSSGRKPIHVLADVLVHREHFLKAVGTSAGRGFRGGFGALYCSMVRG